MKNILKYIVSIIMVCLLVWCIWSWHDVVSHNMPTSTGDISKYNLFALLSADEVESERESVAYISFTSDKAVLFCTMDDGEQWELRVAEPEHWSKDAHYVITFNTHNTADIHDDSIVNVSQLVSLQEVG